MESFITDIIAGASELGMAQLGDNELAQTQLG